MFGRDRAFPPQVGPRSGRLFSPNPLGKFAQMLIRSGAADVPNQIASS
jgi:hypothetical protein